MKQESNDKSQPDIFYGIGVSPGIAIGRVFVVDRHDLRIQRRKISARRIAREKKRFLQAVERSKQQIVEIQNQIESRQLSDNLHFLDILHAHLLILEDRKLLDETCNLIADKQVNAEWALKEVLDRYKEMFDAIEDEYLRERRSDIDSVESRIQRNLLGIETESVATIAEKVIVVAHDLSPADTAQMDRGKIMGFATNVGGKTSHTAIMARSLEIPAVVGLENITSHVSNGDILILDGSTGTVILNPDQRYFN
ncbi:MAG: phosphoenolpyruvate--protein phosphotransferase, partial [Deltaproteobacteria bacterium]